MEFKENGLSTSEEKKEKGKETIVITIEKNKIKLSLS